MGPRFHLTACGSDAVDAIYDLSARHILEELQAAVQREAAEQGRTVHVIAESDLNDVRLTDPVRQGGYGLDAAWNDDFHHSLHSLLTGEQDGYYMDFGQPEHLAKTFNRRSFTTAVSAGFANGGMATVSETATGRSSSCAFKITIKSATGQPVID